MVNSDVTDPDDPDYQTLATDSETEIESAQSESEQSETEGEQSKMNGAASNDKEGESMEAESKSKSTRKTKKKGTARDEGETEEELLERFNLEIEESVANWFDELVIPRNEMPESEDEDEDPTVSRDRKIRLSSNEKLALGRTFFTGLEFREAVLHYALRTKENLKQDRYEKKKQSFVCGIRKDCPWRVYCSWDERRQVWVVKTVCLKHTCLSNGKCRLLKSGVIGRLFMDKLRMEPDFWPLKIQAHIKEQWQFASTIAQVQRGRGLALQWLKDEYNKQFTHINGYKAELMQTNPGSTVIVDTTSNAAGDVIFDRIYVCLEAMKNSFYYCRPLIGIDGTFLKHAVKGCLLTAIAHDPNNQIYPVAWAAVQSENAPNWVWFLDNLKKDLDLKDGSSFVVISDRSKGILHAMSTILPNAEHRHCVKHIVENLKKRHSNKDLLKGLVWHLAWSYNQADYRHNLNNIRAYNLSLYEDILKEEPKHWCRAFQKFGTFCEDVDNNATESFNATIVKARAKALIPMLETIRRQCMARIAKRKERIEKWTNRISEYAQSMLEEEKENAKRSRVIKGTHGKFEVMFDGNSHVLNLTTGNWTCSCGKWQITGVPCEHAYAAVMDVNKQIEDFVSPFFGISIWKEVYDRAPEPVRGPKYWMNNNYVLLGAPPEPQLPGRRKGSKSFKRIKGKFESPTKKKTKTEDPDVQKLSQKGRSYRCSLCGAAGHNKKTCPDKEESQTLNSF